MRASRGTATGADGCAPSQNQAENVGLLAMAGQGLAAVAGSLGDGLESSTGRHGK
jgi:hypothetical protein